MEAAETNMRQDFTSKVSRRYLDEVLLQPEHLDDVVLATADSGESMAEDGFQHSHGDY